MYNSQRVDEDVNYRTVLRILFGLQIIHSLCFSECFDFEGWVLGAVYMSLANPAKRPELCHENLSSTQKDHLN